jgi:hypothetical protein
MSLTLIVLGLSVLGAVLFFAAGFLIARSRRIEGGPGPALAPELEPLQAELDAAHAEREGLAAELAQLTAERNQLEEERATTQARVAALERDLAAAAGNKDATIESLRSSGAKGGMRISELEAQLGARTGELADVRRSLAEATAQLELRDAGDGHQRGDLDRLRTDLERACDEIASLRVEKLRADQANAARAAVEAELQKLKAMQFAASVPATVPLKSVDLATVTRASAASLADLVKRVQSQGHYESVAIADELGLTAAGVGPHTDELAAFTSLLLGMSARASRFFPMHDFGYASLADANGVSIEARPVAGTHGFVLMTLGAIHAQEPQ